MQKNQVKLFSSKRRLPDSNRGIKALQASALPLGQVAEKTIRIILMF